MYGSLRLPRLPGTRLPSPNQPEHPLHGRPQVAGGWPAPVRATLTPVASARVPFLWLCGPVGVGKSSVGYAIFQQVYRSGTKVAYVDLDQVGLCYPSPADDPHNHRVKAQNLGVVWPGLPGNRRPVPHRCWRSSVPRNRHGVRRQGARYRSHAMQASCRTGMPH